MWVDALRPSSAEPRPQDTETSAYESRRELLRLPVALVEDLRRAGVHSQKSPEAFCADYQICLPYRGVFVWHVAGEDVIGDPNQVVYVRAGEPYRMSAPARDGYSELIITPDVRVLSEIACDAAVPLFRHPLFRRRAWRLEPQVQRVRATFLHWARTMGNRDPLDAEELVLALLRSALDTRGSRETPNGRTTSRLIRRTKEYLEANLSGRVLLADVGRAVGASPAYLTDLFRRVEGVSLHRYLSQLRLGRALEELPHAGDLTALALDLGFSSHSHFTHAFRRTFGCTPSRFRAMTRRDARR